MPRERLDCSHKCSLFSEILFVLVANLREILFSVFAAMTNKRSSICFVLAGPVRPAADNAENVSEKIRRMRKGVKLMSPRRACMCSISAVHHIKFRLSTAYASALLKPSETE